MAAPQLRAVEADLLCSLPSEARELRDPYRAQDIWETYCKKDPEIINILKKPDSAFWELIGADGYPGGLYYASEILPGIRATVNILIWNKQFLGRNELHRQMLRYFMLVYNLHRVQATCFVDNMLSQRLQERVGFTKECVMRNFGFRDGQQADAFLYSITRKELF